MKYKGYKIILLLLLTIGSSMLGASYFNDSVIIITLTEDGFTPDELSITRGQTVRFISNIQNRDFWPASDSHPTHGTFPEFDSKRPLTQDEQWDFTFDRLGSWQYHDHMDSEKQGTIIVYSESGDITALCVKREGEKKFNSQDQCWIDELKEIFINEGEDELFKIISDYIENDELFARNCHDVMHSVGRFSYDSYKQTKVPILHAGTAYCGYGYYHGFIEQLNEDTGDYAQSKKYCKDIQSDPRHPAPVYGNHAAEACQHGFGHSIFDSLEADVWGKVEAMIERSIDRCESVFEADHPRFQCVTGIYNALMVALANQYYDISYDDIKDNPYRLCKFADDFYKPACYIEVIVQYNYWAKTPDSEVIKSIIEIEHQKSRYDTLTAFMSNVVQRVLSDDINEIKEFSEHCVTFSDKETLTACFSGIHHGILQRSNQYMNQQISAELCTLYSETNFEDICISTIHIRNYEEL